MVNFKKAQAHMKEVGVKQFIKEFKEARGEVMLDPLFSLKLQLQGQIGMITFSIISASLLFYNGIWYIAGIFVFNVLIAFGQLLAVKKQLSNYKEIRNLKDILSPNTQEGESLELYTDEGIVKEFRKNG